MLTPGIEIISRDRAGAYAEGARVGTPHAQQVADRWHLLQNLAEALLEILQGYRRELATLPLVTNNSAPVAEPPPRVLPLEEPAAVATTPSSPIRVAQYQTMLTLQAQGVTRRAIAQHLHCHPRTVIRWLQAGHPPSGQRSPRPRDLHPYHAYLQQRWQAGCWNATQLYRELQTQGYQGCLTSVRDYVHPWRTAQGLLAGSRTLPPASPPLTPRQAVALVLRCTDTLDPTEQQLLGQLRHLHQDLGTVIDLAQTFATLVRERQAPRLMDWLRQAAAQAARPLQRFAVGIQRDLAAVTAGLREVWSNGQVEGQVNRLKCLKRQMYGRANFDLLASPPQKVKTVR